MRRDQLDAPTTTEVRVTELEQKVELLRDTVAVLVLQVAFLRDRLDAALDK